MSGYRTGPPKQPKVLSPLTVRKPFAETDPLPDRVPILMDWVEIGYCYNFRVVDGNLVCDSALVPPADWTSLPLRVGGEGSTEGGG